MKITNKENLKEIKRELEKMTDRAETSIELNDEELNTETDIYSKITDLIHILEDLIKGK